MGLEYAEKGKNAALDLAEKGKTQALIVNEQGKLLKAQRQLGALVYSLAKGKEENQPLVDKYIEMIDNIEQEIARLKASLTPAEAAEVEYVVHEEVPADQPEAPAATPLPEPEKAAPDKEDLPVEPEIPEKKPLTPPEQPAAPAHPAEKPAAEQPPVHHTPAPRSQKPVAPQPRRTFAQRVWNIFKKRG